MPLPKYLHPNVVTTFRIIIVLTASILILFPSTFFAGVGLLFVASLTDYLDGYLARKYKLASTFGKVYDQISDKVCIVFVMAAMVFLGVIPLWLMVAIIVRDYAMGLLRDYSLMKYNRAIAANWFGKRKTEITALCGILLLLFWRFDIAFEQTKWVLYSIALLANYLSLAMYFLDFLRSKRRSLEI